MRRPHGGGAMSLRDVLIDELRDMYSAENQLVVALPKLAKGAKSGELKALFTSHLGETKGQVERLKEVFSILEEKPTGEHCNGMEGVIEEGSDALEKDEEGPSFDSGIIGAALRTEHYEIAAYEAAIDMAKLADGRADDDDLKQLATDVIEDQGAEITKLTDWRNAWFPEKPQPAINMDLPGMSHGMSGMDLGKLGTLNGKEFDMEFVTQMIPHHEGAIEMARDLPNRTQRTELKELAGSIVTEQQEDIEDMKEWSDEWRNE